MKLSEITDSPAPADSSAPKKLSQVTAARPDPETLPSTQGMKPQRNMLERMWDGLTGKDSTKAGAVGMGMADPVYGGAQIGARTPLAAQMPEAPLPDLGEEYEKKVMAPQQASVDTMTKERERSYQQGRKETGRLGMDWMRLVGNVASPVNLATAPLTGVGGGAGMGLGARLLAGGTRGALAGGMGGAMQPVTQPGNNFASQKAKQMGLGATLGAPLGAAGNAAFGARAPMIDRGIGERFAGSIGLPTKGINASPDMANLLQHAATVVKDVTQNRDKLQLTTPTGTQVGGRLPTSREQFSEAVDQGKDRIFKQFDELAKRADQGTLTQSSPINKFREAFANATNRVAAAGRRLAQANRQMTQALAKQSQAGNVYSSSAANAEYRAAKTALEKATKGMDRAQSAQDRARRNVSRPWVDLKPVAAELEKIANSPVARRDFPDLAKYAERKAAAYLEDEAASAEEAQYAIQLYNSSLKAFYDGPNYETAARASVDAMIATKLREGLDEMVSRFGGPGYQGLKNLYGAYSALEKQITRSALKGVNKAASDDYLSRFVNVGSSAEFLHSLATLNVRGMSKAALYQIAKIAEKSRNDPDRLVTQMFQGAERAMRGPSAIGQAAGRVGTGLTTGLGMGLGESTGSFNRRREPPGQVLQ